MHLEALADQKNSADNEARTQDGRKRTWPEILPVNGRECLRIQDDGNPEDCEKNPDQDVTYFHAIALACDPGGHRGTHPQGPTNLLFGKPKRLHDLGHVSVAFGHELFKITTAGVCDAVTLLVHEVLVFLAVVDLVQDFFIFGRDLGW